MGTKYSDAGLSSASPVAGSEKWGVTKGGVSKYISSDLIWTYFQTLTSNLAAVARVGVRKNSAGSTYNRRRLNLIEGSGVTLTVADDSGNEEVDITIAASGGGGSFGLVAKYELSGSQSITNFSEDIINANTLLFDPGADVTTGASWHYTVPTPGWYDARLVRASLLSNGSAWQNDKYALVTLFINGSNAGRLAERQTYSVNGGGKNVDVSGFMGFPCTTGDTIDLRLYNETGATRLLGQYSSIEIYQVA